ncbi:MAG TPA: hypothetical protein ENH82_13180 [bacterium]|nr:hypothetical protein [bacterium]
MTGLYKSFGTQLKECKDNKNCILLPTALYDIDYPDRTKWCKKFNTRCLDETCLDKRIRGVNPRTGRRERGVKK